MSNPEYRKLAFTAPGPKNSFAPVKQEDYRPAKKSESQCSKCVYVEGEGKGGRVCVCEREGGGGLIDYH